jgi:phosphoribosylglycinamide formyltransferase-1
MNNRIVFLCSGGGGNLRFIHTAIINKWLTHWSSVVVIGDRECPAIDYARKERLHNFIVDFKERDQVELTQLVSSLDPDRIVTTVARILCSSFVEKFEKRLINLHYSLLPAFSGTIGGKPVQDALSYGSCLIGATVHEVTDAVDGGRPQVQIALSVSDAVKSEDTMNLIFRAGCFALMAALRITENADLKPSSGGHLIIGKRHALMSPFVPYPSELRSESFWIALRS